GNLKVFIHFGISSDNAYWARNRWPNTYSISDFGYYRNRVVDQRIKGVKEGNNDCMETYFKMIEMDVFTII
ncbi:MAG: hypothetical protein Q4E73_11800, partial [Lachnospiraceae bacterium]|nr:hypothetical protein [Lachnospiraceae bacterium]